jgi:hypothetical protein
VPGIPGTDSIVYPQEIWEGCTHREVNSAVDGTRG